MIEFKGMQIASAWDIYQSFIRPALQLLRGGRFSAPQPDSKGGANTSGGAEVIQENKAQEGELYALLAWLSTIYMGDDDNARCILEYRVKRAELHIFPKLVDVLPPGAVKRLMQTVAVEVTTVKRKKTTGFTQHKDPRDPSKSKSTPITSEWDDKLNLKGQQVISGLTWLVMNQGSDTEEKRIAAIAKTLQDLRILENAEDKRAAALKATADKSGEALAKIRAAVQRLYGDHDTEVHLRAAQYLLKDFVSGSGSNARPAFDVLMESAEAGEWARRIEEAAQNPEVKRQLQEQFQDWLQKKVLSIRESDGARRHQERQRDPDGQTREDKVGNQRRKWRRIYLIGGIILVISLGKGVIDSGKLNALAGSIKALVQQPK